MKKLILTVLSAASLVGTSTLAAAAPVAATSAASTVQTPLTQPAGETVQGDSQLAGSTGILILILAVVAIGLGVAAASTGGNTQPNSP